MEKLTIRGQITILLNKIYAVFEFVTDIFNYKRQNIIIIVLMNTPSASTKVSTGHFTRAQRGRGIGSVPNSV